MLIVKFYSFTCNLDLDPITLVLEVDLDVAKMNACIENEVSSFRSLKGPVHTKRKWEHRRKNKPKMIKE